VSVSFLAASGYSELRPIAFAFDTGHFLHDERIDPTHSLSITGLVWLLLV